MVMTVLAGLLTLPAACSSVGRPLPPTPETYARARGPVVRDEYRLQVGDVLQVKFPYHGKMNQEVPIRPDGNISLESTGEVAAAGATPGELQEEIRRLSSARLVDPAVVVVVTKLGPRQVYVGGEVTRPGFVTVQEGMTPLQAVLAVGGFKTTAQKDSVLYVARAPDGSYQASRIDLESVVREGAPETVRLEGSDVVYVPASRVANANQFVEQYIRNMLPVDTKAGATASYPIQ
jgi:polysaccharide export outer membrane protein